MPCAVRIDKGRMINITAFGLNPVIIIQKMRSMVAIEFLEAKKPLVVENRPIKASARVGRLMSGDKNTPSLLLCHEKTGENPEAILWKNEPASKPGLNSKPRIVSGCLEILMPRNTNPATMISPTKAKGSLGRLFTIKRRCGCAIKNTTQKIAK